MFKEKKLYKSTDKKLSGVCAGFAEFFGIDPTIVRVIYALIALFTFAIPCLVVYAMLAIIIPQCPYPEYLYDDIDENKTNSKK